MSIFDYLNQKLPSTKKNDDKQEIGIGNFNAFVKIRQGFTKSNQVTNIPLEDGSMASDHINVNPLTLSIEGEVSEVHLKSEASITAYNRGLISIGSVTKYAPARTSSQVQKINELILQGVDILRKIDDVTADVVQVYDQFGNKDSSKDSQEQFIDELDKLMDGKQLIKIEMPYRVFDSMAITELQINRDNTTNQALKFKLTAQQVRFAKTIYTDTSALYKNPASGSISDKTKGLKDKGINKQKDSNVSLFSRVLGR